jgi:REP element-mobilizing transposase RayT
LAAIIRAYKSAVTYAINSINPSRSFPDWQRNYYEHVINSEKEYLTIEAYIENNPANWDKDSLRVENL